MSIKSTIQNLTLRAKVRKANRFRRVCGMSEAKSVGMVCFFEEEQQWKELQKAVQQFQSLGTKVMVLGFYSGKVKPLWYVETMNMVMCSLHEFGLTGIPKGQKTEDFLSERFDILINCDLESHFTTDYVCKLSPSGFKVAIDTEENRKHFDLLIKMEDRNLNLFVEHVLFYLSSFKSGR